MSKTEREESREKGNGKRRGREKGKDRGKSKSKSKSKSKDKGKGKGKGKEADGDDLPSDRDRTMALYESTPENGESNDGDDQPAKPALAPGRSPTARTPPGRSDSPHRTTPPPSSSRGESGSSGGPSLRLPSAGKAKAVSAKTTAVSIRRPSLPTSQLPNSRHGRSKSGSGSGGPSRKSATDIRHAIRSLSAAPVFSSQWFSMCDALESVAAVAVKETKAVRDGCGSPSGRKTLWERDEVCVRFVLEEGKLNLVVRNLREFKVMQRNMVLNPSFKTSLVGKLKKGPMQVDEALRSFEDNLGVVLLACVWAIEAMQTMDMPLLLQHCAETMQFALAKPEFVAGLAEAHESGVLQQCQEAVVLSYLLRVLSELDSLAEDRVVELFDELKLMPLMASFLAAHGSVLSNAAKADGAQALATLVESEAFVTSPEAFLPDDEAEDAILAAVNSVIKPMLDASPAMAATLRVTALLTLVEGW
ncbi:uncharacterized protein AMSG_06839 [Thecamonas trahens ATCC 50062]|uniref:Uncharacterized protein n=1 Tax=Thecamonas trahens ATCC 50062 TaxID=461836 RepID=A0A0L0DDX7_THETB|nr:hypothetical protein AMSG_06839 [Thecamonas trahens ATCC 50062]KNC50351.1 hypothetical protein AMSG_06839 [Thecamonas trahens ATCC 50062]|eukprot:XP_013756895.1 hypothetical protein AMSG_06839 [Thecamonas trahens ATCC 50062]